MLQTRMTSQIDDICGRKNLIDSLKRYANHTHRKHKIRYLLLINSINELYDVKNVDVINNTITYYNSVVKCIDILKNDNERFKSMELDLLINMMENNLKYVSNIRKLA